MKDEDDNLQRKLLQSSTIHELRTHLTAIITSADLLSEQLHPKPSDISGKLLGSITRNAQSMNKKLSQLSETSGFDDVTQPPPPHEDVLLGQTIREVSSLLNPLIQRRRQTLNLQIPDDLLPAQGSRQYVSHILLTLIHNASKFTPSEGSINISARNEKNTVVMEVEDNGIGIPREEWENIFKPHHQLGRRQTVDAGSGRGLSIARFLAELYGGKLWLQSEVGKGSSFFLALPAVVHRENDWHGGTK